MPIYAYRCASCGHAKDVLQKISDPPLTLCPSCGAAAFAKQVTAAGFQLKGSGWYATDFKGGAGKKAEPADGSKTEAGKTEAGKTETAKTETAKTETTKTEKSGDAGTSSSAGGSDATGSPKAAAGCGGRCACH